MRSAKYPFVLRERLDDEGYTALVEMVDERRDEMLTTITDRFERRLTEECSKMRVEMNALINGLRTEMAHQHAELMKWALIFWISQTAAVATIVTVLR